MEIVTLDRDEWFAVARELNATYRETAPPGLRSRVAALLNETPAGWGDQSCTLELEADAAAVVRRIVGRGRGLPTDAGLRPAQDRAVAEAVRFLREDRGVTYRVEHRTGGATVVVARTSAADAREMDLAQHATRLTAAGATGELVLVEEATGRELARRRLGPEPALDDDRTR